MTTFAGFVRLRSWQLGKETVNGTAVAATRRVPVRGPLVVDPSWTDVDVDTGTLDPVLPPYRAAMNVTASWDAAPTSFDEVPTYFSTFEGAISATGGVAKTWAYPLTSTSAVAFDSWTAEWGDDATTDYLRGKGGVVEQLTITYPDDGGPITYASNWRFMNADDGTIASVPTSGLTVASNPVWMYATDTEFYVNATAATIGTTKFTDQFHGGTIVITQQVGLKRFQNGSNTRFAIAGYGREGRTIAYNFRFGKQAAAITEAGYVLDADPVLRFIELKTTSPTMVSGSTPYSHSLRIAGYSTMRADDAAGGNTVIVLSGRGNYNTTLGYALKASVVNLRATL